MKLNLDAIGSEAGPNTREAIRRLLAQSNRQDNTTSAVVKGNTVVISTSNISGMKIIRQPTEPPVPSYDAWWIKTGAPTEVLHVALQGTSGRVWVYVNGA